MDKIRLWCFLMLLGICAEAKPLSIIDLQCEYRLNPINVESTNPSLSWKLASSQHSVFQTAYQILVAQDSMALLKGSHVIWNSGKIMTSQSLHIKYSGLKLTAGSKFYWRVRIWDNKGNVCWSPIASWRMGLYTKESWSGARWIALEQLKDSLVDFLPSDSKKDSYFRNNTLPIFRREFKVQKPIESAVIYISGLGHFEALLNGKKIGDHFLAAGWTKFNEEAPYAAYDITPEIRNGTNALGLMLGNGFYYIPPVKGRYRKTKTAFGYPKLMAKLHIIYKDGTSLNVVSDQTWRVDASPVVFSSIYGGEDYNANLEQYGWASPGFKSHAWKIPAIVNGPQVIAQKEEPVKIFEAFQAKSINQVKNSTWVYDLGQNFSGIIEIQVQGNKGDTVKITPAELLKADGTVNQSPSGSPFYFTYILKGEGIEIWRPRFTYYGFRYLQVSNIIPQQRQINSIGQNVPILHSLIGLHIRNSAKHIGTFRSSNDLFNRTFNLIDWSIKSNMMSVFTDCPHREKLGWLEQLHLMGNSVRFNYDAAPLFRKSLRDMELSQTSTGLIPEIAPEYVKFDWGNGQFRDSPEWGSSAIILPWYLYQWYGDRQVLSRYYPMMKRYIQYLKNSSKDNILEQGLGDWYDLGPNPPGFAQLTPKGLTATAIYYYDLKILEKICTLLQYTKDAAAYRSQADTVRNAFSRRYFSPEKNIYGTGSQTAYAMPLFMEMVDEDKKCDVFNNLVQEIKGRNYALTAGDIGYRYLLKVLANFDRSDIIFEMNNREDVPGYGMQIAKGATSLTESWAALPTVSNNHFMLGHLMEWFYQNIAGIQQDDKGIAFKNIIIKPELIGDLTFAEASFDSPYGIIASRWERKQKETEFTISIPPNTSATVFLPVSNNQRLTELSQASFKIAKSVNGRLPITIGSGTYKFIVK